MFTSSLLLSFQGAVELGIIYGFMALGIFISFRVLNVADLTVDGSFTLGASCSAVLTLQGHPFLGLLAGTLAGALAGLVTAFLQTKLKIQPILAGILTMTGLYSINLRVMQLKANLSLLNTPTIFSPLESWTSSRLARLGVLLAFAVLVAALLVLFFKTQLGMSIRATGDNEDMVRSSSINADFTKSVGLALANAVVGFSGALIAQYQQFSEINMGIGMVVIALASLIIGEVLFGTKSLARHVVAVLLGSIVYRIIISAILRVNNTASDLKLISALVVALALSVPAIRQKIAQVKLRKEAGAHAKA